MKDRQPPNSKFENPFRVMQVLEAQKIVSTQPETVAQRLKDLQSDRTLGIVLTLVGSGMIWFFSNEAHSYPSTENMLKAFVGIPYAIGGVALLRAAQRNYSVLNAVNSRRQRHKTKLY